MTAWIPKPPRVAERIVGDVVPRVPIEVEPFVPLVRELMSERPDDYVWIAAEESALAVLRDQWSDELADDIGRALAEVHEDYLATARCVEQVIDDLEEHGLSAWATRAILAQRAFEIAWDVVDDDEEIL